MHELTSAMFKKIIEINTENFIRGGRGVFTKDEFNLHSNRIECNVAEWKNVFSDKRWPNELGQLNFRF